jgi:hypothetical protein
MLQMFLLNTEENFINYIIKDIDLLYSQHREAEGQLALWPGEQHPFKVRNIF